MNSLLDENFHEIDLSKYKFLGKLAGKSWTHETANNRLYSVRIIIFVMAFLVYWPIITNYLFHDFFDLDFLIERIIFSIILIICALTFPKYRLASMIVALIPIGLILSTYLIYTENFSFKRVGFMGAIFSSILFGIYNHFVEKRLRLELISEIKNGNTDAEIRE